MFLILKYRFHACEFHDYCELDIDKKKLLTHWSISK